MAEQRLTELLEELKELHERKSHDYGANDPLGNFEEAREIVGSPYAGVLVRMGDKWSRIKSLYKKKKRLVEDESEIQTLKDLAVYALIAIVLKEREKTAKMVALLERSKITK